MSGVNKKEYYMGNYFLVPKTNIDFGNIIPTLDDVKKIEAAYAAIKYFSLEGEKKGLGFDINRLKAIHKHLYGEVYEWAGKARSFQPSEIFGGKDKYAKPEEFDSIFEEIESDLIASEWFEDHHKIEKDDFVDKIANVYSKITYASIFPDCNSLVNNEFISDLASEAGYYINFSSVSRKEWDLASNKMLEGNFQDIKIILQNISTENPLDIKDELEESGRIDFKDDTSVSKSLLSSMKLLNLYDLSSDGSKISDSKLAKNNPKSKFLNSRRHDFNADDGLGL